jgi:hypothetical protein
MYLVGSIPKGYTIVTFSGRQISSEAWEIKDMWLAVSEQFPFGFL